MGRKKKKSVKPWCWYCNREFNEEKVLIYHQKAKHFKCPVCSKKSYTGPGLALHCMQVHRHEIKEIPNAMPGRTDPDLEIYGTEGIPFLDMVARCKERGVEYSIREKNIANAALPAKYERTLETPYGTQIDRVVQPLSPSQIPQNTRPLFQQTNISPDQNSKSYKDYEEYELYKAEGIERIILPAERCKLYHPLYDISLEEHRIKIKKYTIVLPTTEQQQTNIPISCNYVYPYPFSMYPQQPQYPYVVPPQMIPEFNNIPQPFIPNYPYPPPPQIPYPPYDPNMNIHR